VSGGRRAATDQRKHKHILLTAALPQLRPFCFSFVAHVSSFDLSFKFYGCRRFVVVLCFSFIAVLLQL
jgi:hypothetical protein